MQSPESGRHELTLNVTAGESRSALNDASTAFLWAAGDSLSVYTTDGSGSELVPFTTASGGTSTAFKGLVLDGYEPGGVAIYPYNAGHSVGSASLSFVLPSDYMYTDPEDTLLSAKLPMLSRFSDPASVSFRHLGGALRIKLKEVPAGSEKFVFKSSRTDITGIFSASLSDDTPVISPSSVSGAGKSVTIHFGPLAKKQAEMDFIIPMPVCTLYGWEFELWVGEHILSTKSGKASTVERCSVLETVYSCVGMTGDFGGN